ncbi:MAG: nucleotidyltransferase substrate binding protein [Holosporales bacterium]|jgi:nucleotidyltransferase substrate binding protein (TIGR01987 family)
MTDTTLPRWVYRFDNYRRAFGLMDEAVQAFAARPFTALEKEGIIQRFEYTWELAWKVLKDYLEHGGIVLETVTPASVIRAAFAADIIKDGQGWMDALKARNEMAHTYDEKGSEKIVYAITAKFFPLLKAMHTTLLPLWSEATGHA